MPKSISNIFKNKGYITTQLDIEYIVLNQSLDESTFQAIDLKKTAFLQPVKGELSSGIVAFNIFNCWIEAEQLTQEIKAGYRLRDNNIIYNVIDAELYNTIPNQIKPFYKLILEKIKDD